MAKSENYKQYTDDLRGFMRVHGECTETSTNEAGITIKTFIAEDGAEWHEVSRIVTKSCDIKVAEGIFINNVDVRLYQTEYWYTGSYESHYLYERA